MMTDCEWTAILDAAKDFAKSASNPVRALTPEEFTLAQRILPIPPGYGPGSTVAACFESYHEAACPFGNNPEGLVRWLREMVIA